MSVRFRIRRDYTAMYGTLSTVCCERREKINLRKKLFRETLTQRGGVMKI